ncbi:MAG: hypothetical protein LKM39_13975 [Chiayiivirga sp.]|jgi:hypothetical protein|nr:hypothetical protein [Chiayiivirga sp.]
MRQSLAIMLCLSSASALAGKGATQIFLDGFEPPPACAAVAGVVVLRSLHRS